MPPYRHQQSRVSDNAQDTMLLDIDEIRRLSAIQPGRAELRAAAEFTAVALLIVLQERVLPLWCLPLTLLLIASRQHALMVIMHEGSHYRISTVRWWNEFVGEAVAWPLFVSMRGYRRHHQKHHVAEALNTTQDPDFERKMRRAPQDWTFPLRWHHLARLLVRDVLLLNTHEYVWEAQDAGNAKPIVGASRLYGHLRLGFTLTLIVSLSVLGGWRVFLLYWLLPALTGLKAILRVRSIADHFAVKTERNAFAQTRTILAPWWERLLIAPASISVHGPHHAYASIPYYNLRAAHLTLMQVPEYASHSVIAPSYWAALTQDLCK